MGILPIDAFRKRGKSGVIIAVKTLGYTGGKAVSEYVVKVGNKKVVASDRELFSIEGDKE